MEVAKVILNGVTQMDLTSDTVAAANLLSGYTAHGADGTVVNGLYSPVVPLYQSKTVTPSTASQTVIPDSGYSALSQVVVTSIPSNYIVPSGTYSIYANGTYNIAEYESAFVSVAGGGGGGTHTAVIVEAGFRSGGNNVYSSVFSTNSIYNSYFFVINSGASKYYYSGQSFSFIGGDTISISFFNNYAHTDAYTVRVNATLVGGDMVEPTVSISDFSYIMPDSDVEIQIFQNNINFISNRTVNNEHIIATFASTISTFTGYIYSDSNAIRIREFAFFNSEITTNTDLTSIYLPSVKIIDTQAFHGCGWLSRFYCPELTTIGTLAFAKTGTNGTIGYSISNIQFPKLQTIRGSAFAGCFSLSYVSLDLVESIGMNAFFNCSNLISAYFSAATSVGQSAFVSCGKLISAYLPLVDTIGSYAFTNCVKIQSVYCPDVSYVYMYAFSSCCSIVDFPTPNAVSIQAGAFTNCSSLTSAYSPNLTSLGGNAFSYCYKLVSINFPKLSVIQSSAFGSLVGLRDISLPSLGYIPPYAFRSCSGIISVSFPQVSWVGSQAFAMCYNMSTIIFNNLSAISGASAFYNCRKLLSFYLLYSSNIATLAQIAAFNSTPLYNYTSETGGVYGSFFVPEALYSIYISATNWATYSDRFVPLTDAQISNVLQYGTHEPT